MEDLKAGGGNHLKAHSYTYLVLNIGVTPHGTSPRGLGFFPTWRLGFKVSILQQKHRKRQQRKHCLCGLASEVTQHHFCNIWDKVWLGSRKGDIDPNGGMSMALCRKSMWDGLYIKCCPFWKMPLPQGF